MRRHRTACWLRGLALVLAWRRTAGLSLEVLVRGADGVGGAASSLGFDQVDRLPATGARFANERVGSRIAPALAERGTRLRAAQKKVIDEVDCIREIQVSRVV